MELLLSDGRRSGRRLRNQPDTFRRKMRLAQTICMRSAWQIHYPGPQSRPGSGSSSRTRSWPWRRNEIGTNEAGESIGRPKNRLPAPDRAQAELIPRLCREGSLIRPSLALAGAGTAKFARGTQPRLQRQLWLQIWSQSGAETFSKITCQWRNHFYSPLPPAAEHVVGRNWVGLSPKASRASLLLLLLALHPARRHPAIRPASPSSQPASRRLKSGPTGQSEWLFRPSPA